jgi:hypothetical protein
MNPVSPEPKRRRWDELPQKDRFGQKRNPAYDEPILALLTTVGTAEAVLVELPEGMEAGKFAARLHSVIKNRFKGAYLFQYRVVEAELWGRLVKQEAETA